MNPVASQMVLVEVVEVAIAKIVVGDVLGKHVIDGDQDLMGNRYGGPLVELAASTRAVFKYTLPLGMLLLRLPADSLLPGQTPAQEATCETLWDTFISTPSSAMITTAKVRSTPGSSRRSASWAA